MRPAGVMDPVGGAARHHFLEVLLPSILPAWKGETLAFFSRRVFGHPSSQAPKLDAAALECAGARERCAYPYILANAGVNGDDDDAEMVLDDMIIVLIIASGVPRLGHLVDRIGDGA